MEFGYSAEEIKDRNVNVKILLPDALAAKHDGFLLNYQRTKKKSMIGNKRRDRAKRKDGTEFPIEAYVSEIVMDGEDHSFYSAYIRNISDMMELELTKVVSGVISDLSPIPLIAIKERGTVLQINAAGASRFGYEPSEVVGQNIKMLMPEATAKKHDGYLSAYAKTGEKHVIDTTRIVKAQSKTGEIFTVEIGVRELMTEVGGEKQRMYWGFLRDCTVDIQRDRGLKLAKAVLEMSTVPLLQIDHVGTIQEANPATTVTFGFARDEMIGKNVKMLMPFQIAMRHDGFLKRYAETRVKSVIDTTREVEGQHKKGNVFKVEISVREVEREDGQPPVFVAYLVDLTERIERARLTQLTSATKSSSPMPLIVMDEMGYVLEFNGSAEELWNYQASEVIGQNIKMLMPEEIAANHDGYLAKYRETGVQSVVGSTRMVHARRNGGERVPVSITVREITLPGDRKRFVGYVEDRSGTYASLKAAVVGEQIIDMLPVGVIGIDEIGTIRMFNPHASDLWGFSKDEVMGKNVKMLMPEDIAVRHDDILARYKATGVKSVVGTTRSVQAKLKEGTIVPVDLDVREYTVDGTKLFVGYCRDRRIMDQIADESELSHSMVKRSPEMIVVMDAAGQVLEFNQAAQSNFGFTHEEIVGRNIKALMTEDVAVNHDGYLKRYVDTGVKKVIDGVTKTHAQRKDGTVFPVELRIREIKGRTREQSKFVGFVRDRTNDLVNEANAAVCAAIGQLMPDGLIVISDVGTILTFTHQAEISFGYKAEEVVGQNIKMLTPPEIAKEHDGYLSRYRETGVKHVVDTTRRVNARRKNGSTFEAELRITEYRSNNEVFFIGFVRDCSDDYAEVIARTLTNSLFDVTPEAMVAIDKIGTIVNFNAAAESLFDFERSIALGRNIKILMPDKHALRHDQYLAQYQRHKIKRVVDNVRFVLAERKNGTTFPAEISVRETTDINGEPLFVGYLRDMTGRVDMKDVV
jgi:PAS domain S-box-containing protein